MLYLSRNGEFSSLKVETSKKLAHFDKLFAYMKELVFSLK